MLCHHVFFWLKKPTAQIDKDKLIEGVRSLQKISHIKSIHIGIPASTENRDVIDNSYSLSELVFFESIEAEKAYQSDPIHLAFVEDHKHLWEKVVVYDSIDI